jgi:hypothetical protein
MKTQSIIRTILVVCFISVAMPSFSATTTPVANTTATENPEQQVRRLEQRLEEIKGMDHKKMSSSEKRALRKEVRAIKKEMAEISGGVYISVGALLLIILLIILLA